MLFLKHPRKVSPKIRIDLTFLFSRRISAFFEFKIGRKASYSSFSKLFASFLNWINLFWYSLRSLCRLSFLMVTSIVFALFCWIWLTAVSKISKFNILKSNALSGSSANLILNFPSTFFHTKLNLSGEILSVTMVKENCLEDSWKVSRIQTSKSLPAFFNWLFLICRFKNLRWVNGCYRSIVDGILFKGRHADRLKPLSSLTSLSKWLSILAE